LFHNYFEYRANSEFSRIFRFLMDISRNLALVELGKISRLIEFGGFLKYKVHISKNLRLIDLSKFPRF
jgi:hypothetical protein